MVKSFLIKTIRKWVLTATDKGVADLEYTGIAAVNVSSMTIHRPLMLPVEHGKTPKCEPLFDDTLKITQDVIRNVTLIIIDEISMVSNVTTYRNLKQRKLKMGGLAKEIC